MPTSETDSIIFETIALVGVGLIGGSIGMAAKKRRLARRVIGVGRSEQKLMRAKILGAVDDYSLDFKSGAAEADLLVICTPVRTIIPILHRMAHSLKEGAVVTDVGSTKAEIVRRASRAVPRGRHFVGGHPMAGSERAGVDAAFPDLFLGATYVITPTEDTDLAALGKLAAFVEAIGADVEEMSPEDHDRAAAVISHLPHAMAAALLATAEESQRNMGTVYRLAAGSFRDLTRISDSPPELWRDICISNAESLGEAIDGFQRHLDRLKEALASRDEEAIQQFFEQARRIRQTYLRITK